MKQEGVTVAAEDERDVEDFGVIQRLLDARADCVFIVLRLNDGDGNVRFVIENVVGPLPGSTGVEFPPDINPAVREADFLTHLVMKVPPGLDKMGRDELGTNIALAEGFLVHTVITAKALSSGDSIQPWGKNLAVSILP